ncbi:MAG TPA: hypothetical protein VEK57_03320 [Thermoanaerobaculia bacterium]|nr:hypothetical protein [Thermoanaerobaculia bacterium]
MLRTLYLDWRAAVALRSERGELRAGNEEQAALDRFLRELETLDEEQRAEWESLRATLDTPEALCACGHPLAHHDESGSCFHVVGCATGCACNMLG